MLSYAVSFGFKIKLLSDSLSLLPPSFTPEDASKLSSLCQSVELSLKSLKAHIFGDFYVLSNSFMKDICDRLVKEMETFAVSGSSGTLLPVDSLVANEAKSGHGSSRLNESNEGSNSGSNRHAYKASRKKKVKATVNAVSSISEGGPVNQEETYTKSKKSQRSGKDSSSLQMSDSRKESLKMKGDLSTPSEEWIMQKIVNLVPDFEEQDDPETILRPLANHLRSTVISSWTERKKALFTENAEKMKRLLDNLQRTPDEENHNKLKTGHEVEEALNLEPVSPTSGDRTAFCNCLPGDLANKAFAAVKALEGKEISVLYGYVFASGGKD
ncbi:hypothetical protein L6164_019161 [Bauhinia variegata]|uniref:Uncharacterized protein n=1 Tax=Bauhinia variegata TaxID=167791 RepID=A0ACB9NGZ7_BAUVA|nr:hypothetical protein L6164_019161 [Bauhinia variegata]